MKHRPLLMLVPGLLFAAAANGQQYMDYAPWEGEWEEHHPTVGQEYEYEWNSVTNEWVLEEIEPEQYEYEADEGYHEQEWYDPSDWFELGSDMEYESDWLDYDYGRGYDYGYEPPPAADVDEVWLIDDYGYYDPDFVYFTDDPWYDTY